MSAVHGFLGAVGNAASGSPPALMASWAVCAFPH